MNYLLLLLLLLEAIAFCVMTPCSLVGAYHHVSTYTLSMEEADSSKNLVTTYVTTQCHSEQAAPSAEMLPTYQTARITVKSLSVYSSEDPKILLVIVCPSVCFRYVNLAQLDLREWRDSLVFLVSISVCIPLNVSKVKVKLSLQQAVEAHRVVRRRGSHIF
jgi:hypothetical protein